MHWIHESDLHVYPPIDLLPGLAKPLSQHISYDPDSVVQIMIAA